MHRATIFAQSPYLLNRLIMTRSRSDCLIDGMHRCSLSYFAVFSSFDGTAPVLPTNLLDGACPSTGGKCLSSPSPAAAAWIVGMV